MVRLLWKKVAPVKQPLLRSKQATSESLLSLYSLCLSTTIPWFLSTSWPLPENYRLAAANCGRSWPRGWLLIRFDFPHQRLQGGLGLGRNGLVDNDDNNQDLRPVLCLLRAWPVLSALFVFFVWFLAKSLFVRDTQSDFWFVCFLLVNFSTLLLPNIMYIRQRQVGETIYNLLIRRYCEKE